MKKLAAILAMCFVMTSALVSCSDADESSGSSSGKAASSTSASDESSTAESSSDEEQSTKTSAEESSAETSEAASDKEDATSTDTTNATKELPTGGIIPTEDETKATADTSTFKGGDLTGEWSYTDGDDQVMMSFNADKTISTSVDFSDYISFKGKQVIFDGESSSEKFKVDFDGKKLKVTQESEEYLVLERVSGETSADNMDGTYNVSGGLMASMLSGSGMGVTLRINGENTYLCVQDFGTYEVNGNKITLTEKGETDSEEAVFNVDGDKMTIVAEDGEVIDFTRVD